MIVLLVCLIAASLWLGGVAAKLARGRGWRESELVSLVVAAATFAIGWYVAWSIPARQVSEHGHRVCGAAGAALMLPLLVFTPLIAAVALVVQSTKRPRVEPANVEHGDDGEKTAIPDSENRRPD